MGVGGNFWDLLKPHARIEGFDFLRNKRVAIDLSYWIVQHETAIKGHTRKPHIRLTFFRTINLFSKFGAYPIFVLDGTPSPLKSQARIARYFKSSGLDVSSLPEVEEGVSVERNGVFKKCVEECVELLELLGMPVLKAKGEAEALCAQLNRDGNVDAIITADSDAFLYGAKCVIKRFQPNSKEPFECYHIADIEAKLGVKRKHLIALSLLVGNDHDLRGIKGIGIDTAFRFVKCFNEEEILIRLHEIGRSEQPNPPSSIENSPNQKITHCSLCGHPGSKRAHLKLSCEYCKSNAGNNCFQKPVGFKCNCSSCECSRKEKENKKSETWTISVCQKISSEKNFPNDEIIKMYLDNNHGTDNDSFIRWASPRNEMLVDYLSYQQNWEPSYIRQRLLPMLSTIYLRNMALNPTNELLYGQFEFHNIQRIKMRYGHEFFVVNWKKAGTYTIAEDSDIQQQESIELDESINFLEDPIIYVKDGSSFLSSDEDMELVKNAFPEKVENFFKEKELKELKSRKRKQTPEKSESSVLRSGQQLSIMEFYRSSKVICQNKGDENVKNCEDSSSSQGKRKEESSRIPKAVRRKLLFG